LSNSRTCILNGVSAHQKQRDLGKIFRDVTPLLHQTDKILPRPRRSRARLIRFRSNIGFAPALLPEQASDFHLLPRRVARFSRLQAAAGPLPADEDRQLLPPRLRCAGLAKADLPRRRLGRPLRRARSVCGRPQILVRGDASAVTGSQVVRGLRGLLLYTNTLCFILYTLCLYSQVGRGLRGSLLRKLEDGGLAE